MAATRGIITDATPLVSVRFDDGDLAQVSDIEIFLRLGIPVTAAINIENIRPFGASPSRMSVNDLIHLKSIAARHLTSFEIAQHGNTTWTREADIEDYTWAQVLAEVDPSQIEALGLGKVSVYLQPGDVAIRPWCRGHATMIADALSKVGIDYAIGLRDTIYSTCFWATPGSVIDYHEGNGRNALGLLRPGHVTDPYAIPGAGIVDLGSFVVPRRAGNPQAQTAWLLGVDAGNAVNDFDLTWQFKLSRILAIGASFLVGLHGAARSNLQAVSFQAGAAVAADHMNYEIVASHLRDLQAAGLLRCVTLSDWAAHVYGQYAPGTELINNPDAIVPTQLLNDDAAGDICAPAGWTAYGPGVTAWDSGQIFTGAPADGNANQLMDDSVNEPEIENVVGANAVGVRGRLGAIVLRPGGVAEWTGILLKYQALTPGHYTLELDVEDQSLSAGQSFTFRDVHIIGHRWRRIAKDHFDDPNTDVLVGETCHLLWEDRYYNGSSPGAGNDTKLVMEFHLPENAKADHVYKGTHDPASMADDDFFDIGAGAVNTPATVALAGVQVGGAVRVFHAADVSALNIEGEIVAGEELRIRLHNKSGGVVDIPSGEWAAAADREVENIHQIDRGEICTRWDYSLGFSVVVDGAQGSFTIGGARLFYNGPSGK